MKTESGINKGLSILRDYSGGSKATTVLCMDSTTTFYRKYAVGEASEKLLNQEKWIENNINKIPLPNIINTERGDNYFFYDMEYSSYAVGLFEYAHSMPVDKSWTIIKKALDRLNSTVYRENCRRADKGTVKKYYLEKVKKNLEEIKQDSTIKPLQKYGKLEINGEWYKNLPLLEEFISEAELQEVFKGDTYSNIHGDLTVENIICTRNNHGLDDYYFIDPNTENIHESRFLDYAKLLQSLHGGYEFLDSVRNISIVEDKISFSSTYSNVYAELYKRFQRYLKENFSMKEIRSIYYHEMIHWIRLIPYRILRERDTCVAYYATMILVMNDVLDLFREDN